MPFFTDPDPFQPEKGRMERIKWQFSPSEALVSKYLSLPLQAL
jgi:hypothetical protein